jgi:hypothetical protein
MQQFVTLKFKFIYAKNKMLTKVMPFYSYVNNTALNVFLRLKLLFSYLFSNIQY